MTRPWSAYLRKAIDLIPPMPVNLREQLVRLLVPELADLRLQLDQARRLAGEAQKRYREEQCHNLDLSGRVEQLEKQLASQCHGLERECNRLIDELARAKADLDERHGPLCGPIAMEREQLRARVAELEVDKKRSEAAWDAKPFFQGDKNP